MLGQGVVECARHLRERGLTMSWIIRWLWKRYGGATALQGGRAFWFGDGRPRAAGWIQWHWWRRAFLVSWATFILMVWWFLVAAWTKGLEKEGLTVGVYATMAALMMGNFVPACLALWDERTRQRLRREPTALMFVVFVGSLFVSMTLSGLLGASWNGVVNGLIIGLSIFVLSCGMLFPLGLAPAAAVWTWATVRREDEVSARYAWGMGALCGAGWMIAIVVGMIGGAGGKGSRAGSGIRAEAYASAP